MVFNCTDPTALWMCLRYLEYCLDPEKIRKQDATFTIVYIANNPIGQPLAWDFIRSKWDYIFNKWVQPDVHTYLPSSGSVQLIC